MSRVQDMVEHPTHYTQGGIEKPCSSCEEVKPLDGFGPDRRTRTGRAAKCRACAREVARQFFSRFPEKERRRRERQSEYGRLWYERNRDRMVARFREASLRRYGLTTDGYRKLLAAQKGSCAICRASGPGRGNRRFLVDHDHQTGVVRGLLCHLCNVAIGHFRDDVTIVERAVAYLRRSA
jgi:hypothetical protein